MIRTKEQALHVARTEGKSFEEVFEIQSRIHGMMARKIPTSCRFINGSVKPIKSELDWVLCNRETGMSAFVDTKSFEGRKFQYSDLKKSQLDLAISYNYSNVPSGFCVHFRESKKVCFFSGRDIERKGPKNSFSDDEGIFLGTWFDFSPRLIFTY